MSEPWVIVDASLVIKAILPNPEFVACQEVMSQLSFADWFVPMLWHYEIANTITKAVYFKQLTRQEGQAALQQTLALPVQLIPPDMEQSLLAFSWSLKLQRASIYDCYYLALAETIGAEFWTADKKLYHALDSQRLPWLHLATNNV
jgi:predicted nucleic acid-binding protein